MMKRTLIAAACACTLFALGCDNEPVNAPPPPPPPARYAGEVPPLVRLAERNGFRAGYDDGARDAYYRAGYAPRRGDAYRDAPGYDYRLGPIQPYVDSFRGAYLSGYERGFYDGGPDRR